MVRIEVIGLRVVRGMRGFLIRKIVISMKQVLRWAKRGVLLTGAFLALGTEVNVRAQELVTVSARRYIKVIQPMELAGREINNYRLYSLADAVRYYSGVQFKDYGGLAGFKTINVRSLGSERLGVFYNGIELSNAQNGQIDLTKFSMENMGSLALYSGQKGDIFQSATDYASAGSLYINSQRPLFTNGEKSNFKATLKGGSHLLVNPSILLENDLGNYITTSVNLELVSFDGNYPFRYQRKNAEGDLIYDEKGRRKNNEVLATRLEGSLNGIFDRGVWSIYAYNYNSQRGIPGAIVNNVWYKGEDLSERNSFVQGTVKIDVIQGYRTQVNFKLANDYTHYINNDDRIVTINNSFRQWEAYISNSHLYTILPGWDATGAYDLQWLHMQKYDEVKEDSAEGFARPWRLKHLLSLATQGGYKAFSAQASVLGTYVMNFGEKEFNVYGDEYAVSPTVLLSYTPFRRIDFSVQAFVKQTFRVPNYNDRYVSEVEGEKLNPETMMQYSLGLLYSRKSDGTIRDYGVTAEAYYHDVKNKIVAYPKGQLYRWSMVNLGKVQIIGGDAVAYMTMRFLTELDVTAKIQYTYQQARDITNEFDTYYNNQIPNIPWHSGSAILGLNWRGWGLNYSFLYVGARYSRQENIPYYKMQPWYTHDLSVHKRFNLGEWNFRCMLEVNNVLGEAYEIITNYPMPKQFFRLSVSAEI